MEDQRGDTARLLYKGTVLGTLTAPRMDGIGTEAAVVLNEAGSAYEEFFYFMTDESRGLGDDYFPFDEELLEPTTGRWNSPADE